MKSSITIHMELILVLEPDTINHTKPMHIYHRSMALSKGNMKLNLAMYFVKPQNTNTCTCSKEPCCVAVTFWIAVTSGDI